MLLLPLVAQNTQFWNSKHGKKKWSKLYQTICFDTALQMNIVSSELVLIFWQFLAFVAEKLLILLPEAQNTQFWNKKHGQKWSNLYQNMCVDTVLQMIIIYSGLVMILWPFLAFCNPKMAIYATRGTKYSILKPKHGRGQGPMPPPPGYTHSARTYMFAWYLATRPKWPQPPNLTFLWQTE